MNELMTIKGTRGYLDENGTAHLNLEDVARGLGIVKRDVKGSESYERIHKQNITKWLIAFGLLKSENDNLPEFIPENIFYKLCFKASNETARVFQDLVTDEILPTIRKTGGYVANDELFIATYMPYADESMKQLFRLTLAAQHESNKRIAALKEENEVLEIALDESLQFCTVRKYNEVHGMGWSRQQAINVGRRLTAYCKRNSIKYHSIPDPLYGSVHNYPVTAWAGFMKEVSA